MNKKQLLMLISVQMFAGSSQSTEAVPVNTASSKDNALLLPPVPTKLTQSSTAILENYVPKTLGDGPAFQIKNTDKFSIFDFSDCKMSIETTSKISFKNDDDIDIWPLLPEGIKEQYLIYLEKITIAGKEYDLKNYRYEYDDEDGASATVLPGKKADELPQAGVYRLSVLNAARAQEIEEKSQKKYNEDKKQAEENAKKNANDDAGWAMPEWAESDAAKAFFTSGIKMAWNAYRAYRDGESYDFYDFKSDFKQQAEGFCREEFKNWFDKNRTDKEQEEYLRTDPIASMRSRMRQAREDRDSVHTRPQSFRRGFTDPMEDLQRELGQRLSRAQEEQRFQENLDRLGLNRNGNRNDNSGVNMPNLFTSQSHVNLNSYSFSPNNNFTNFSSTSSSNFSDNFMHRF